MKISTLYRRHRELFNWTPPGSFNDDTKWTLGSRQHLKFSLSLRSACMHSKWPKKWVFFDFFFQIFSEKKFFASGWRFNVNSKLNDAIIGWYDLDMKKNFFSDPSHPCHLYVHTVGRASSQAKKKQGRSVIFKGCSMRRANPREKLNRKHHAERAQSWTPKSSLAGAAGADSRRRK